MLLLLRFSHSYYLCFRIKNDDKMIQAEGVESLSEAELREDCRERGMLGVLSVEEMRQQVLFSIFYVLIYFSPCQLSEDL